MFSDTFSLGTSPAKVYQKLSSEGRTCRFIRNDNKTFTVDIATEVTKSGQQRTMLKFSAVKPVQTNANGAIPAVYSNRPVSATLTLASYPSFDGTEISDLLAQISLFIADTTLLTKLKNGEG